MGSIPKELVKLIFYYYNNNPLQIILQSKDISSEDKANLLTKSKNEINNVNYLINWLDELVITNADKTDKFVEGFINNKLNEIKDYTGENLSQIESISLEYSKDKYDLHKQYVNNIVHINISLNQ